MNEYGYSFKIKRTHISEYYTSENGDHVSITIMPDDTATLIACRPVNNEKYFLHEYKSRRAALIAMHRKFGKCQFNSMTHTFRKV